MRRPFCFASGSAVCGQLGTVQDMSEHIKGRTQALTPRYLQPVSRVLTNNLLRENT